MFRPLVVLFFNQETFPIDNDKRLSVPDRAVPGFEFADRLNRHSDIPPRVLGLIDQLSENRCRAAARPRLKSVNLSEAAIIFIDA